MDFNNTPNEKVKLENGDILYKSRSCAVVGHIMYKCGDDIFMLMIRRGSGSPNNIGKWCLPCGYLDWNESLDQAITREIWEESGVDILNAIKNATKVIYNGIGEKSPWLVVSEPKSDELENVCHHFAVILDGNELPKFEERSGGENDEVDNIQWVHVKDLHNLDIAFGHLNRIDQLEDFLIFER